MRKAAAALLVAVLVAACSGDDDDDTATTTTEAEELRPLDDELRLNDVQVLGTHNSYHLQAEQPLFDAISAFDAALAVTLEYSHVPLVEQLEKQGIRQFEIDVYTDREGGMYATPAGADFAGVAPPDDPAMQEPGFKVLHIQDVDYRSTCPTLVACLTEIRDWSLDHPGHVPIFVMLEMKDSAIPDPGLGFVVPTKTTTADYDALDDEVRSVFDADHLITPDDVRGDHDSLEDAVLTDGWPTLGESRGKVLFGLVNGGELRDLYVEGHPALEGRVLFTTSGRGTPESAFLRIEGSVENEAEIRQAVLDGYIVRARSDADTVEARSGDTATREAALRSGATYVSTDYPVDDPRFEPDFTVAIPGGTPGRCNPVRSPEGCTARDVEDPALLDRP